jgi:hypothetical protein
VGALLNNGLMRMKELADESNNPFTHEYIFITTECIQRSHWLIRELRERRVFKQLLVMIPGLEERLMDSSAEDIVHIGELVRSISILNVLDLIL